MKLDDFLYKQIDVLDGKINVSNYYKLATPEGIAKQIESHENLESPIQVAYIEVKYNGKLVIDCSPEEIQSLTNNYTELELEVKLMPLNVEEAERIRDSYL